MRPEKGGSSIFSAEALLRYLERQEMPVYPRLVSPRGFALLWVLLAAIVTVSVLILTVKTPVTARGLAVASDSTTDGGRVLSVFVSAEYAGALSPGKDVSLESGAEDSITRASIIDVAPSAVTLPDLIKQFGVSEQAALRINYPAVMAVARAPGPMPSGGADSPQAVYDVRIVIGYQRAISHLNPISGQSLQLPR